MEEGGGGGMSGFEDEMPHNQGIEQFLKLIEDAGD